VAEIPSALLCSTYMQLSVEWRRTVLWWQNPSLYVVSLITPNRFLQIEDIQSCGLIISHSNLFFVIEGGDAEEEIRRAYSQKATSHIKGMALLGCIEQSRCTYCRLLFQVRRLTSI
jgi:hypothetical protein